MASEIDGNNTGFEVHKSIEITSPNKTLDSLIGKETQDSLPSGNEAEVTDTETSVLENTQEEGEELQVESNNESQPDDSHTEEHLEPDHEDEDVDLTELVLDVDGQERSVSDLLTDYNALRQKFDQLAKDEFLNGFINHYLTTGNASAYLDAKGVDWDKKDDVEILRLKFEKEYADLDERTREKLWKRELADKYKIKSDLSEDELASDDYQIAQGLLKRDAKKIREEFKESQKKFQIVDKPQQPAATENKFNPELYKREVLKEKEIAAFMKSKLLALSVKDEKGRSYGYETENADQIIEMMVDDRKFLSTFYDFKTKKVDRLKQAKIYAFASNIEAYENQLVDFGKNLGLEDRLKEEKNTDGRLNKQVTNAQTKETNWTMGFLNEALKQKK
jgi:hypothetical protein